ncbi:MAG: type III pantothenate kinase, partial [Oscillibacter sp.]|nr:type III pantothenate kinase [Oscillibacter sp.]
MLFAVDVGNSTISLGLLDAEENLRFLASLNTDRGKTADQICVDVMNVFTLYRCALSDVSGSILCSVVPPLNPV